VQTVGRAIKRAGVTGEPLPDVFPSLARADVRLRRGGTSLVAGYPGAFKSTFALNNLILWARDPDFVALYISADSDEHTVAKRCAAIMSGDSMTVIDPRPTESDQNPYNPLRSGDYDPYLKRLLNIHWEFRSLKMPQIDDRMTAIKQIHGKMPDLLVIDNLMNMVENPTDYGGQMTLTRDLDTLARAASCHVMILHHTHERPPEKGVPTRPQPIWEIHGKVNQFPRLVLTMAAQQNQDHSRVHLMVACVKNTNGPADRTGREYSDFEITTGNARVNEIQRG
jgi:hypothetical protein